ncbi:hypothetical protein [Verminephrobacter eiseniae]|uniref:hypothetical protein n=1 Tax=Verminephrobacter eiseniae TaxID=364317 RepID=UPI0002F7EA46|nr:hypothetical protein [Verminephrobacter eiseniae]
MSCAAIAEQGQAYQAIPLSGGLGAELRGIVIQNNMPQEAIDFIYQMLLKHWVVFFRN